MCSIKLTVINEPGHAQAVKFLVKEFDAQLTSQQWHVLNDGQTHTPLWVLGQLDDSRQQALWQLLDTNHLPTYRCIYTHMATLFHFSCIIGTTSEHQSFTLKPTLQFNCCTNLVDAVQIRDDVQANLRALVLQLSEEEGQQVFNGAVTVTWHYMQQHVAQFTN